MGISIYQLSTINLIGLMGRKVHSVTMKTMLKAVSLSSDTNSSKILPSFCNIIQNTPTFCTRSYLLYLFPLGICSVVLHPSTYMFSAITENCIACGTGCYVFFLLAIPFGQNFTVILGTSKEHLKTGCTFHL